MTPPFSLRASIAALAWIFLFLTPLLVAETSESDSAQQIGRLRAEIAHHDDLYFRDAAPEITDFEYDLLKLELRKLENESGLSPSPTSIGDDRSNPTHQVAHGIPMLSLDKVYSDIELAEFFQRVSLPASAGPIAFLIEPKFDGVAVSVVLNRGEYQTAATRGNGAVGEDITAQVEAIRSLGYEWEFDTSTPRIERIELRGEIYLSNAQFEALNRERVAANQPAFRHPRSVAAGSIKLIDLAEVASRGLSIVFHGWGDVVPAESAPKSMTEFHRWLDERGLPSAQVARFIAPENAAALNHAVDQLRASISTVPIDGVVIKIDSVDLQGELGNGPAAPRWAVARKFAPPRARTVLRDIVWQVGRTGALTPVAEFDPVILGGATIRRASLGDASAILRRDLRLADSIWIEKAGEIIPQLAGVEYDRRSTDSHAYALPEHCPACDQPITATSGATELRLLCENYACGEQVVQRLLHFVSKGALDIKGVGPSLAHRMVGSELVLGPSDLYALSLDQLIALPRVGEKTARRLMTHIDESRGASVDRWIIALGLPGVGPGGARQLSGEIESLEDLLDPTTRQTALQVLGESVSTQVEAHLRRSEVEGALIRLCAALSGR